MRIVSRSLGPVYLDPPLPVESDDLFRTGFVIYADRLKQAWISGAVEWAAGSQAPIFCHERDVSLLAEQGFGTYRFHGVSGYREMGFQGGVVEFYPARRKKTGGLGGVWTEFLELFGFLKAPAYHVLVRPRHETTVLYLSSPEVDAVEWKVFSRAKPGLVVGAPTTDASVWKALSAKLGVSILTPNENESLVLSSMEAGELSPKTSLEGEWTASSDASS